MVVKQNKRNKREEVEQMRFDLPDLAETADEIAARHALSQQILQNQQAYLTQLREIQMHEQQLQQARRAKKYGVVSEALTLARRNDEKVIKALRQYAEALGGDDIKVSKYWLIKTSHPNPDELIGLFKLADDDSLHFCDVYFDVVANIFETSNITMYTRDVQGLITGSQIKTTSHTGIYTLAEVGLAANLGIDWERAIGGALHWQWHISFGHAEVMGDAEHGLVSQLRSTGLNATYKIGSGM
jgi:hypothetical protein